LSLPERLSENLYKEGLVSEEDREIVEFGLESLGGNLAGVFLTLLVGFLFGIFLSITFPVKKKYWRISCKYKNGMPNNFRHDACNNIYYFFDGSASPSFLLD